MCLRPERALRRGLGPPVLLGRTWDWEVQKDYELVLPKEAQVEQESESPRRVRKYYHSMDKERTKSKL